MGRMHAEEPTGRALDGRSPSGTRSVAVAFMKSSPCTTFSRPRNVAMGPTLHMNQHQVHVSGCVLTDMPVFKR